jgi:threonine/homoserine/homoserine lactone efflux protein
MLVHWLAAAGVLGFLAVVPGPDVAVVSRYALRDGRGGGLRASAGVVAGLVVWALLAVAGLAALLAASGGAYDAVRLAGAVYLMGLGLSQLWASRSADRVDPALVPRRSAWRAGLLTNLLNPKVAVIYTALLPSLLPRHGASTLWLAGLAITHIFLSFIALAVYSLLFSRFRGPLSRPSVRVRVERMTGLVLVGLGIRVAVAR